jgi:MATE family multidrug resistance protein
VRKPIVNAVEERGRSTTSALASEARAMLALALPVVVSELGWMAMSLVDTIMVGRLGKEAIGAVGLGNIVFYSVVVFGIGLVMGLDTLVSQAFGAGNLPDCHRSLVQGVYLSLAASPLLMAAVAACVPLLELAGIEPAVASLASPYLGIMNWGLAPLLVFFALRRYLQGMNLVMPALVSLLVANLANWFGNWVLVYGHLGAPAMGVRGSAWATVISRFAMLAMLAGWALTHAARHRTGLLDASLRPDVARLRRLLALGLPAGVQYSLETLVFGAAAFLAGRLGATALAAHEVVLQVAATAFMVPLGVSAAGSVRVGQAIGRGDPAGAARSGWVALAIGAGFMAISALTMIAVPGPILGRFTTDAGVLATSRSLLLAAALFQVFDGTQVVGAGALRGLGETRLPMCANLFAHWAIGLPIGYLLAFPGRWGALGLWMGLASGLIATATIIVTAWWLRMKSSRGRPTDRDRSYEPSGVVQSR